VHPYSRGRLWLRSADPLAPPAIDPATFAEPADLEAMVDALEAVRSWANQPDLGEWGISEVAPGPDIRTRGDLRDYARGFCLSYVHPAGTCRMGVDRMSVVDPELRVHGVSNLRIADTSVIPAGFSGNTNAPAIMFGERVSEFLLASGDR
jgi:choline dehydrogenase